MERVVKYEYYSWTLGCECCSDSTSSYTLWEDGIIIEEDAWCDLFCDEEDLREQLKHLEPFDVDPDSVWF